MIIIMKINRPEKRIKIAISTGSALLNVFKFIVHYLFQKTNIKTLQAELLDSASPGKIIQEHHEAFLQASNPADLIRSITDRKSQAHRKQMQKRQVLATIITCSVFFSLSTLLAFNEPVRKIVFAKGKQVFDIASPVEKPVRYVKIPHLVPDSLDFCGEQVPLENKGIFKKMRAAIIQNRQDRAEMNGMARRAKIWFPVIIPILKKYNVPEDFKYIPLVETGFINATSPRGAAGFWQLMQITAKDYGLKTVNGHDQRLDVTRSTVAACRYLRYLHSELGSWTLTAAAFNMGLGGIRHKVNSQNSRNYYSLTLNRETATYIYKTVAIKHIITKDYKVVSTGKNANQLQAKQVNNAKPLGNSVVF